MATPQTVGTDEYTHYHRTCQNCGRNWWGLHCPHDGIQNPCPSCKKKPATVPGDVEHCDCEFAVSVPKVDALIRKEVREARVNELRRVPRVKSKHELDLYKIDRIEHLKSPEANL
jgi:hypothetical protein